MAERTRPVSSSQARLLPLVPPLVGLFPDGALRRGSTVVVDDRAGGGYGGGATSLALSLLVAASGAGSWCARVGMDGLGAVAARELGST